MLGSRLPSRGVSVPGVRVVEKRRVHVLRYVALRVSKVRFGGIPIELFQTVAAQRVFRVRDGLEEHAHGKQVFAYSDTPRRLRW